MTAQAGDGWVIERGIGETRAARIAGGAIVEALVEWPDLACVGSRHPARLVARPAGGRRGLARLADGTEVLVDRLPPALTEGAAITVTLTREAMAERGRMKRAQGRAGDEGVLDLTMALIRADGPALREALPGGADPLSAAGWDDLWMEAWDGAVSFAGGSLTVSPTPAMTLIDIDGDLPPPALARAAVPAVAAAIRRYGIGGSIGIDFPTLAARTDRQAVDSALAGALAGWRHDATAMNGFGFVQLVARAQRPSLVARIAHHRAGAAARMLLRRAERAGGAGPLLLACHPAVRAAMRPGWIDALARRSGRELRWREDAGLALHAGFAQAIAT